MQLLSVYQQQSTEVPNNKYISDKKDELMNLVFKSLAHMVSYSVLLSRDIFHLTAHVLFHLTLHLPADACHSFNGFWFTSPLAFSQQVSQFGGWSNEQEIFL